MVDKIPYEPHFYVDIPGLPDVGSAWKGVDRILYDIVNRFNVPQGRALEFGVEHGFSTSALATVFKQVVGVDTFIGDQHSGYKTDHFKQTCERLKQWPNITIHQARYQDWIKFDRENYDLIHIDIVHTFEDTYRAGFWAVEHAPVVIFHDTESFRDVRIAVETLTEEKQRTFYNYHPCHGLGILVKE